MRNEEMKINVVECSVWSGGVVPFDLGGANTTMIRS